MNDRWMWTPSKDKLLLSLEKDSKIWDKRTSELKDCYSKSLVQHSHTRDYINDKLQSHVEKLAVTKLSYKIDKDCSEKIDDLFDCVIKLQNQIDRIHLNNDRRKIR